MTKDIIKDKFLPALLLVLPVVIVNSGLNKINNWWFLFTFLSVLITIICLIYYLKTDLYLIKYSESPDKLNITYQRNFSKKQINLEPIYLKSIKSVTFGSNSLIEPFHKICIKYKDENGLHDKKTFKVKNDKTFAELLYKLKQEEK